MDWSTFRAPADWKQTGGEWSGPCPVTGHGKTKAWANPDAGLLGCRCCGEPGTGRLDGEAFKSHARALGILRAGGEPWGGPARGRAVPMASSAASVGEINGRRSGSGAAAVARTDRPRRVWRVSSAAAGTPGAQYLAERSAWSSGGEGLSRRPQPSSIAVAAALRPTATQAP